MSTNLTIEDIQDILKIEFEFTRNTYLWSTWIFPDGTFIAIDTFTGDIEDYDDVLYEHAHIIYYLEDNGVKDAEKILEENCIKINYMDPYVALPTKNRLTQEQWRALRDTLKTIYESGQTMSDYDARRLYSNAVLVGYNNNSFRNIERTIFIPVITSREVFLFDCLLYGPEDIVKELKYLIRY